MIHIDYVVDVERATTDTSVQLEGNSEVIAQQGHHITALENLVDEQGQRIHTLLNFIYEQQGQRLHREQRLASSISFLSMKRKLKH